jgi:hypothetical protein
MKKVFLAILGLFLSYHTKSYPVVVSFPNTAVLMQRLKALDLDIVDFLIKNTTLIAELANQSKDTDKIVACVNKAVSQCIKRIKSQEEIRKKHTCIEMITEALIQHSPEAIAEFSRYYKL